MLRPGTHVNAVGSCQSFMRELDPSVVMRSKVFVDMRAACLTEPGDLVQLDKPESQIAAEVVNALLC